MNTLAGLKSIRASRPDGAPIYVIMDNGSAHKGSEIRGWAGSTRSSCASTYASWANPIEAHFGPLRQFTIAASNHPNHMVQTRALHAYLRWRNANARLRLGVVDHVPAVPAAAVARRVGEPEHHHGPPAPATPARQLARRTTTNLRPPRRAGPAGRSIRLDESSAERARETTSTVAAMPTTVRRRRPPAMRQRRYPGRGGEQLLALAAFVAIMSPVCDSVVRERVHRLEPARGPRIVIMQRRAGPPRPRPTTAKGDSSHVWQPP